MVRAGVYSRAQLLDGGAGASAITRAAKDGRLRRVGPGLFASADGVDDLEVAQAFGTLSHATAARIIGFDLLGPPGLHVTAPHRRRSMPPGVQLHRAGVREDEIVRVDGLRVTAPAAHADRLREGTAGDRIRRHG